MTSKISKKKKKKKNRIVSKIILNRKAWGGKKVCSLSSFTLFLKSVHTFVCIFKDQIITKTLKHFWKQKTKRLQAHSYHNSAKQWTRPTRNMLSHCTIRYFYYLNFRIQKAIFAEHIEPVKKFISILIRCILSCCHTVALSLSGALFKYENCTFSN